MYGKYPSRWGVQITDKTTGPEVVLSAESYSEAKIRLETLDRKDSERRRTAELKNNLEGYIYSTKEKVWSPPPLLYLEPEGRHTFESWAFSNLSRQNISVYESIFPPCSKLLVPQTVYILQTVLLCAFDSAVALLPVVSITGGRWTSLRSSRRFLPIGSENPLQRGLKK